MSNTAAAAVRKHADPEALDTAHGDRRRQPRDDDASLAASVDARVDARVERSTRALGRALVALVQERDYGDITVRDIVARAGVGRTTFYAHYRNKDDVLHSSYEHVFGALEAMVERPSPVGHRLFPVAEFLAHVRDAADLVAALRRGGLLGDAWALYTGSVARLIERRLDEPSAPDASSSRPLVARMLAGALTEATAWWLDHPSAATPLQMDAAFHALARGTFRPPWPVTPG